MKKGIPAGLQIPLPLAPAPLKVVEPVVEEPTGSCPTALISPIILGSLQGICVFQLPFPGVLSEKDQREKLTNVVKKHSKYFEIRFDAVPNNSTDATQSVGGRRFQPLPLIRRALIVVQKLTNCEQLLNELNQQKMLGCQLKASMATAEDLTTFLTSRTAKPSQLLAPKPAPPPPQSNVAEFQTKRPQNLLRLPIISPPAAAVKAMIFDAQNHGLPDPFSKNSSRTLYIKHLETNITEEELKTRYERFGHILDIEVKNRNTMAPYAFIQYTNIESVSNAIKQSNQQQEDHPNASRQKKSSTHHWWGNTIVSNRLWVGFLPPKCGEQYLASKVRVVLTSPEHDITKVDYDPAFNEAVLIFTGHEAAQIVFNKVKMGQIKFQPESSTSTSPHYKHVHVDFCSEKLHSYFVDRLFNKNVEVAVNPSPTQMIGLLPSPPEQPRLPAVHPIKKASSPSPPPDPSTESVERRPSISMHTYPRPNSLVDRPKEVSCASGQVHQQSSMAITVEDTARHRIVETRQPEATAEEKQQNRRSGGKPAKQQHSNTQEKERRPAISFKRSRSKSTSSQSSTDTYSMPRRKWRSKHPTASTKEHSLRHVGSIEHMHNSSSAAHERHRQKPWKKQSSEAKYSRGSKPQHRMHRSIERRRTRPTDEDGHSGNRRPRKHELTKKRVEERTSRDYNKTKGTRKSETGRSRSHHKGRSKSNLRLNSSSLLPPPPVPPTRMMDRVEQLSAPQAKPSAATRERSTSCSSCSSNSSCSSYSGSESCSTCSFNEESPNQHRPKEVVCRSSDTGSTSVEQSSDEDNGEGGRRSKEQKTLGMLPISEREDKIAPEESAIVDQSNEDTIEPPKVVQITESVKKPSSNKLDDSSQQQKVEKPAAVVQRTDSICSELAHKRSSVQTPGANSSCSLTARLRTLLRSNVIIPLTQSDTSIALIDPRKPKLADQSDEASQLSLELPRFALRLKLPKRTHQTEVQPEKGQKQNEHKPAVVLRQPKKEDSIEDPILLGTPVSATPTVVPRKLELLGNLEEQERRVEDLEMDHQKDTQHLHPVPSFTKVDSLLKGLYESIETRRNVLRLDKIPRADLTNIQKVQQEIQQILSQVKGTPVEDLPNLVLLRSNSTHHSTKDLEPEFKLELNEPQQPPQQHPELHRQRAIGSSSFSLERNIHKEQAETIESSERRNTFPIKGDESPVITKPKGLLSRPRASSSSVSKSADETSSPSHKLNEFDSPKMESQINANKSITPTFTKPQIEREETFGTDAGASASPKSKCQQLKKPPLTIMKKPSAAALLPTTSQQSSEKESLQEPHKHTSAGTTTAIKAHQKLVEPRKSSHQLPLVSKHSSEHRKNEEKSSMNAHRREKEKDLTTRKASPSPVDIPKKPSSNKEEKRKEDITDLKKHKSFSVGSKDQLKSTQKQKGSSEGDADSDVNNRKSRKKRRRPQETSSSDEEEDEEESVGLFDIELEEQKKILEAIKSGKTDGLSMYDRVKRRSSQRPDEEKKKASVLEQLREKQAKKKKEPNRVRLLSTSSDSDGSKVSATRSTSTSTKQQVTTSQTKLISRLADEEHSSEQDEDIEVDVDDSLIYSAPKVVEPLTIRKPEIAPRKPMVMDNWRDEKQDEEDEKEEDAESKHFSSSVEWNLSISSDGDEAEDPSRVGEKVVRKLKMEFGRCRSNSQSSMDEHKDDLEQKLARVVESAKEDQEAPESGEASNTSSDGRIDESSSSSSSDSEGQQQVAPKGVPVFMKRAPKVTGLSMQDVFGKDSDEENEKVAKEEEKPPKPFVIPKHKKQEEKQDSPKIVEKTAQVKKSNETRPSTSTIDQRIEPEKDKKVAEQLRYKSHSFSKGHGKHTSELKKLKRQSPIRSISIEDLHGKLKEREKHKSATKRAKEEKIDEDEESHLRKRRKSVTGRVKPSEGHHPPKGIKRQQREEEEKAQKGSKRSKWDLPGKPSTSQEKQLTGPVQTKSPEKQIGKMMMTSKHSEISEDRNSVERVKKDSELAIGLLGIVAPVTVDEFEVIDSGKVPGSEEALAGGKLESSDGKEKAESEKKQKAEEEEKAELLRKMEQNEEEEAVAALKLQTTATRRDSQEMEGGGSSLGSYIKPMEHSWPTIGEVEASVDDKGESVKAEDEASGSLNMAGRSKEEATTKEAKSPSNLVKSSGHELVEKRQSNESVDAQMISIGSGFVEVDAEVLKEQQERERLAEERQRSEEVERRKKEEAKRLEATVDFVASNAAREGGSGDICQLAPEGGLVPPPPHPMAQPTIATFAQMPVEFLVQTGEQQQERGPPLAAALHIANEQEKVPDIRPVHPMEPGTSSSSLNQSVIHQQPQQSSAAPTTKQQAHRIGVIVSEAQQQQQLHQVHPTSAIHANAVKTVPDPVSGTHPTPNTTIFVHSQPQRMDDTFVPSQQPINLLSDVQTSQGNASQRESAVYSASTSAPVGFFAQSFEQQPNPKIFLPHQQQLGGANIGHGQQKQPEKKLSQQPAPVKPQIVPKKASINQPQHTSMQQQQQFSQQQIEQQIWQNQMAQQHQQAQVQTVQQQQQHYHQQQQRQGQAVQQMQPSPSVSHQMRLQQQQQQTASHSRQQQPAQVGAAHAQEQQQQLQQQAQADQLAAAAAAAASSGLVDPNQVLQLYQRLMLTDSQSQLLQQQQAQQTNLSAAMMAAAASNQQNPTALAKWQNLFSVPTSSSSSAVASSQGAMNPATIEALLRQSGLLGHPSIGLPSAVLSHQGGGMTAAALEDLYRQQFMAASSSPRLQPQLQATIQPNSQQLQQQQHEHFAKQQQQQPTHRTQIPPIVPLNPLGQQQPQQQQLNAYHPQRTTPSAADSGYQQQQSAQTAHMNLAQRPTVAIEQAKVQRQNTQAAPLWQGQLAMKNADTLVLMHKVRGNEQLVERMNRELVSLNEQRIPLLRITQRMRLEQSQLDSVLRKMEVEENYVTLICFPCGRDRADVAVQTEKMRKAFIDYFLQKSAAGIANSAVPNSCVAHIFAPDDFIKTLLAKDAPDILRKVEQCNAGYLFVILTNN